MTLINIELHQQHEEQKRWRLVRDNQPTQKDIDATTNPCNVFDGLSNTTNILQAETGVPSLAVRQIAKIIRVPKPQKLALANYAPVLAAHVARKESDLTPGLGSKRGPISETLC